MAEVVAVSADVDDDGEVDGMAMMKTGYQATTTMNECMLNCIGGNNDTRTPWILRIHSSASTLRSPFVLRGGSLYVTHNDDVLAPAFSKTPRSSCQS